ncbi:hypothetical protein A3K93_12435 [Acinetobacter sp. NCu2D-2]|uniref:hypothetical protein n=1 Tax=Acinetobacter sp. NCu2D-2 TaxID=1608473 RepID=UPI0007CDD861|nr:hypothetical protein [Acinetobacter sp. NCu2D-2]ANF82920.1 hypothetical protein A3K93_12435 [Acinetobacter sp. NCu2D-2]
MNLYVKVAGLTLILFLTACQNETEKSVNAQQHFICQALIQGFLSTQQLTNYELNLEDHPLKTQLNYTAQLKSAQRLMPQPKQLQFNCIQAENAKVRLHLVDPTQAQAHVVLSLNIPKAVDIKRLTAYQFPPHP